MRPGENPTYDHLMTALQRHLAGSEDIHVASSLLRPEPEMIGSARPGATAWSGGRFIIGVAKTGYQLEEEETLSELSDFLTWRGRGDERALIHLVVPDGWRERAEAAFVAAGGTAGDELNNVITVGGLGVPKPD